MRIDDTDTPTAEIARRDLFLAAAGVTAIAAVGLSGASAVAQNAAGRPAPGKVAVERRGAILLIGIDRAHSQNRLDPATLVGISKAYSELERDEGLRVAVLYGIGPDFSLGGDVAALAAGFAAGTFPPREPDYINPFNFGPFLPRTKPVIVAAHGGTKFGGHELFLACDIRVAASDTVFGQAEVTRGVFPGAGGAIRMSREAGWGNAMLHVLTGEEWTADEGYRLGLVQALTPPGKQTQSRDGAGHQGCRCGAVRCARDTRLGTPGGEQRGCGLQCASGEFPQDFAEQRRERGAARYGRASHTGVSGELMMVLAQTTQRPAAPSAAQAGNVHLERRGSVLLVGINRPEARNLLDPGILIGLGKALYLTDHDDALRVTVMYGIGRDFSVGADLPALVAAQAAGQFPPKDLDFIGPVGFQPPFRSKPVVVAVHGSTKLGGHELFLAADIRVAAADTVFSQNEVSRGGFPSGGATVRFPREAGWANAMRYMLTGDEWNAAEARRMGLVQEVVPVGKQLERAFELAQKIATAAPLGIQAALASAREALPKAEATAYAALPPARARLAQSEDAKEARRALQEGRTPVFTGH